MRIGIDFTAVIYNRGVSRYTLNLARELAKLTEVKLTLFGYSLRKKKQLIKASQTVYPKETKFLGLPNQVIEKLWDLNLFGVTKFVDNLDLFHSWDWLQPPDKNIPIVSTIHDLAILKFPQTAHPKILKAHQKAFKKLKENRSHIITVSQATKKDVVNLLNYPAYMVHVVHEALPKEFLDVSNAITEELELRIKQRLNLNKPYILFVGTREPRKNLNRLIQAWQELANQVELVVAGDEGWDNSEAEASKLKYQPRFLGKVSDQELSVLYANASVFAYPSLYEGFGLPILESFHHGTAVVTSNNSGMLEVAGNAAELVDPESSQSILEGLKKVLNETPQEQKKRLQRMIIRQQMFNWQDTAKKTLKVYQQAIKDFKD